MEKHLDIQFVRQHFPAFYGETRVQGHFFESAGGSFPCQETIEALNSFYGHNKIQPGYGFPLSQDGMDKMLLSKQRWAEALGVKVNEVGFGPSTSQNTYVLANAFRELLKPGDEVVLWGHGLPIEEIADKAGTIGYELLCKVNNRVRFVG